MAAWDFVLYHISDNNPNTLWSSRLNGAATRCACSWLHASNQLVEANSCTCVVHCICFYIWFRCFWGVWAILTEINLLTSHHHVERTYASSDDVPLCICLLVNNIFHLVCNNMIKNKCLNWFNQNKNLTSSNFNALLVRKWKRKHFFEGGSKSSMWSSVQCTSFGVLRERRNKSSVQR